MKLQPLNPHLERPDVLREKHRYGIWFGLSLGLGFAFFTWGVDSYTLSLHHGLLPWLKFALGAVICMAVGAIAGWLAALSNKPLFALLIWLVAGSAFAWLTINLPLMILPKAVSVLEPQAGKFIDYTYYDGFGRSVLVAYAWVGIFAAVAGILQIPMSDSAVFSTSIFGKLGPILLSVVLMAIAGSIVDNGLVNKPLRDPIVALDNTLQFILENRGREVDPAEARRRHTGAFRAIDASVTPGYRLIVREYDSLFVEVHVLVKFERDWVDCQVISEQPIQCEVLETAP